MDEDIITFKWSGYNLQTRQKMKTRLDLSGLHVPQHINFVRLVDMEKEFHAWCHHDGHLAWVQFTNRTRNEAQNWYLRFYMYCNSEAFLDL